MTIAVNDAGESMPDAYEQLDRLYAIGGGNGATRIGYSAEEEEAHRLAERWMTAAGLETSVDRHGNLFGRLRGFEPSAGEIWVGSHLDTVPNGGKYDGALGVVAALAAARRTGRLRRTIAVAVFRDEERGCIGSRALVNGGDELPAAYVEVHHEQGTRLGVAGVPVGVVGGIVGYVTGYKTVTGRGGHAGTTSMQDRDDALATAAQEFLRIYGVATAIPEAVATIGKVDVQPGAGNVIPGAVRFSIDARAPDVQRLDRLADGIGTLDVPVRGEPVSMGAHAVAAIENAIERAGLRAVTMVSAAGHDAGILAAAGVSAGMIFVRAQNDGASHSPDELVDDADVDVAIDVLTDTMTLLDADGDLP